MRKLLFSIFVLIMPFLSNIWAAEQPKGYAVEFSPDATDRIQILIDMTNLPKNMYLENVDAWVGFYNENKHHIVSQRFRIGFLRARAEIIQITEKYEKIEEPFAFIKAEYLEWGYMGVAGDKADPAPRPSLKGSSLLIKAPTKKSDLDVNRDISVAFTSQHEDNESGYVIGKVKNKSLHNEYQCVLIKFNLYTRFDLRETGEKSHHLGFLTTRVSNILPRSAKPFKVKLPYPAGIGLNSVRNCPIELN